jgi:hypothetical protein
MTPEELDELCSKIDDELDDGPPIGKWQGYAALVFVVSIGALIVVLARWLIK